MYIWTYVVSAASKLNWLTLSCRFATEEQVGHRRWQVDISPVKDDRMPAIEAVASSSEVRPYKMASCLRLTGNDQRLPLFEGCRAASSGPSTLQAGNLQEHQPAEIK